MFNRSTSSRPRRQCLWLTLCLFAAPPAGALTAHAADMAMPTKAPPAPVYDWSGCYGGINAGAAASGSNFGAAVDPGTHLLGADPGVVGADGSGSHNNGAFIGGGQVGCNLQSGLWVVGLEGDYEYFHSNVGFTNNTNTLSDGVTPFTVAQSLTTDFLATVRPRVGIAADRNFAYITGGLAFTRVNYGETYFDGAAPAGVGAAAAARNALGWTIGAGWEYALFEHWTFKAEYLFVGFPTTNALGAIADAGGGVNTLHGSADLTIQVLRAGLNFKF
jgi:outer membrane immunogenic protein